MLGVILAIIAPLACHNLESDFIRGKDLANAVAAFASIPSDTRIGASPLPGQQRVFRPAELRRIAQVYNIQTEPGEDVCFAWATAVPDRKDMEQAMQTTLAGRDAKVEILEGSNLGVPKGEIVFPLAGLTLTSTQSSTLWRGYVRYGETRRFPVWARVIVTLKQTHLVAVKDLTAGEVLDQNDFKSETYEGPLLRDPVVSDRGQAEGMRLKFAVRAGSAVLTTMLDAPWDVNRGELVNAIVENGGAHLEVQARAEESARTGQIITLRNLRSGRSFRGRVEAKGVVLVVPGGQYGLAVETKKS